MILTQPRLAQNQTIKTQREIQALIQREPQLQKDINLLTTIPGIGKIVAVHLLARIGDGRLIERTKQVPAFLGLVPRENSTGDSVRRGPITKSGDSRLRNKLVQSAWMAIRTDGALAQFYHHILARNPKDHGAGKAIVACARKLGAVQAFQGSTTHPLGRSWRNFGVHKPHAHDFYSVENLMRDRLQDTV